MGRVHVKNFSNICCDSLDLILNVVIGKLQGKKNISSRNGFSSVHRVFHNLFVGYKELYQNRVRCLL